mgnify:CR=1 FL=1
MAIESEIMFKMLLIGYLLGIRSETRLIEDIIYTAQPHLKMVELSVAWGTAKTVPYIFLRIKILIRLNKEKGGNEK